MLTKIICGIALSFLVGAAVLYRQNFRGKILKLNAEIKRVLEADNFVDALKKSERLAPAWRAFEKSLTRTNGGVYSTTEAAEFFSVRTLTQGLNMTFWQSYGGIFTGLGILGTFAGLTFGLIGVDITSGDIDTLKDSIQKLLSGVQTAFITSLFGIGVAIAYSFVHHNLLKNLQANVKQLTDKLDENFPRRSIEDWLSENFSQAQSQTVALQNIAVETENQSVTLQNIDAESQSQTQSLQSIDAQAKDQIATLQSISKQVAGEIFLLKNSFAESKNQNAALQSIDEQAKEQTRDLKNIGEQVATAIYEGLDERINDAVDKFCVKLEEKILPQVDRICDSIDKLSAGGGEAINEIFTKGVGSQMDRFSAALENFTNKTENILANAQEVSTLINGQLLATLKTINENLKRNAETANAQRNADYEKFLSTLKGLTDTMNAVVDNLKQQQEDTAKNFEQLLKVALNNFNTGMNQTMTNVQMQTDKTNEQNRAASENFLSTLSGLTKTMNAIVDNLKQQQEDTAKNFEQLLKVALNNFNTGMNKTMTNAQMQTDKTNEQNRAASENFLSTLSGLTKTMNEIAEKFKAQQFDTAKDFEKLLQNSLDNFIEIMAKILEDAQKKSDNIDKRFLSTLSGLTDTLNTLVEKFKVQQDTAASNFEAALHSLIEELKTFTEQQKKFLDGNAGINAAQINEAVEAFREIVDRHNAATQKTFDQIQKLLYESEDFLESVDDAGTSLKQAAEPVKQSTLQLTQNLTDTSEQMKTLATANQTTRENLVALSTRLATFVQNFNGIADQLERATATITDSLDNYNGKMSVGLKEALHEFDSTVDKAHLGLNEIVGDLTEALDEFNRKRE